jgi:hypothetical protein
MPALGVGIPSLMWLTILTPANYWAEGFTGRPVVRMLIYRYSTGKPEDNFYE